MRYTGNLNVPGKSSTTLSSSSSSNYFTDNTILPGRLSVDENVFCRRPSRKDSDVFSTDQVHTHDSESEYSNRSSPSVSFRKPSMEVSSKYLQEIPARTRRGTPTSNPASADSSPRTKKFSIKNAIRRANSLTGYGSAMSQWALSPGRSGSPPVSVETKSRPMSFSSSSLKPPTSPSKAKGVEKLLNLGLMELFKSKRSSSLPFDVESVHQLRILHNRLIQWQFANVRADSVNLKLITQVEKNLIFAWDSYTKLQHSVVQKKIKLQKEKLEMKLDSIFRSQIKRLEAWGDIERQHLGALSMAKESLHSVVCRVPLIEGAKVDLQSASIAVRHGSDLTVSSMSMLSSFSSLAERTVCLISELAKVVSQEKLLLEECHEHFRTISQLMIQEMSLKSQIIQMGLS
ncbi:QWRF motif-containing protein 3-like [Carica papaya]|uniref:QWRF motif-containing protein 3-like n=1 Tax=Carica papaya TaxID=3649 RepID=UPI000B8CBBB0|nr:QWRF motif-containing protein 3-like [Carica papaya]